MIIKKELVHYYKKNKGMENKTNRKAETIKNYNVN